MLEGLRVANVKLEPSNHPTFHPGKCARVMVKGQTDRRDGRTASQSAGAVRLGEQLQSAGAGG